MGAGEIVFGKLLADHQLVSVRACNLIQLALELCRSRASRADESLAGVDLLL